MGVNCGTGIWSRAEHRTVYGIRPYVHRVIRVTGIPKPVLFSRYLSGTVRVHIRVLHTAVAWILFLFLKLLYSN